MSKMPKTILKTPSPVKKKSVEKEAVEKRSRTNKKEKEPPNKKQKFNMQSKAKEVEAEPEEDPQVQAQKAIESSRDLVAFKHLTMGVEGFRREGVHMANRIQIESEKEKQQPDINVLIGEKQGIMAPSSATQWHFNPAINEAQQSKFGEVASTAQTLGAKKGADTPLSDLGKALEQLKETYLPKELKPSKEVKKTKKRKEPEIKESLRKQKEVEKAVVKQLNRYSKEKEELDFIPSSSESESEDEDNPQSYQVTRERGAVSTGHQRKKRKTEKGGKQVRVTAKKKAVTADETPQYSNFVKASKLDDKALQDLHQ